MEVSQLLSVAEMVAYIMLESGAEIYRVEETVSHICTRKGVISVQVLAIPTGAFFTLTQEDGQHHTMVVRVKKRAVHLSRIHQANAISRNFSSGKLTLNEAHEHLERLMHAKPAPRRVLVLAAGLSSGFFTIMLGGGLFDFFVALLCGTMVQGIASSRLCQDSFHFLSSILGGCTAGLVALSLCAAFRFGNVEAIIAGAIMPLVPGIAMANAIRDTFRGDLVSGTARGIEALLVAICIAAGVGITLKMWAFLGGLSLAF